MAENYARENSDSKNCRNCKNTKNKVSNEVRNSEPMSKQSAAHRKISDCDR